MLSVKFFPAEKHGITFATKDGRHLHLLPLHGAGNFLESLSIGEFYGNQQQAKQ